MNRTVARLAAGLAAVLFLWAASTTAHEVRPGYLRIQQVDTETYDVLFRVPARGEMRLGLYARLPDHCETQGEMRSYQQGGAFVGKVHRQIGIETVA